MAVDVSSYTAATQSVGASTPFPVPATARPRAEIRPIRVATFDNAMQVLSLRGVGHRAGCSCGWRGPQRRTLAAARSDRREHEQDHAQP